MWRAGLIPTSPRAGPSFSGNRAVLCGTFKKPPRENRAHRCGARGDGPRRASRPARGVAALVEVVEGRGDAVEQLVGRLLLDVAAVSYTHLPLPTSDLV